MPTIMDVARAAGVGIGTVSRVLNNSPLVSGATRQRVLETIQRLGYQPSPIARAFGGRRTDKLEILVPVFAQAFVLELLRGIELALADTDYTLLIRSVKTVDERERVYADCCLRGRTEGVLVVWMPPTEHLVARLNAERFPAVLLNSAHPKLWSVGVDHTAAAERAVTYCAQLGHRRIALVDRGEDPFEVATPGICRRGYQQAMAAAGLGAPSEYHLVADNSAMGGAAGATRLLQLPQPPTAIVTGSEAQAIGVLDALRTAGIRVPEELSVVGYNDSDISRDLGLTTIQVPLQVLGEVAAETLLMVVAEPDATPQTRSLPTDLVVRRTCGPPAPDPA
jgi:DNA-binding LacI/PurR family transcriptional regulator